MKVSVSTNFVSIIEQNILNKGEYNIHEVEFQFSEEYTQDLVKIALFTQDSKTYKIIINNDKCEIPAEVLAKKLPFVLGVYAYKVESDELVLRYSPAPTEKYIICGSYIPDSQTINSEPITPSELEQFQQIIEDALAEVANVDIDVSKVGHTTIVTITNREGEEKTAEIQDGENGQDAKINGYNTLTIQGGTNIDFDQVGNVATINNTYTYDDTEVKTDIETIKGDITDINTALGTKIDKDVNNLTYYTLTTQTGSRIDLEINSSTYVLVAKLYDKNNNLISTSSNIDLPLETMVVGASYDSTTKEIVLTLKSGDTVRFSVADLVSGLQTEITSDNKLNADLVDDSTSTNKFVTSAEKTQISTNTTDISNIKNGTNIDSFGDVESALEDKEDVSNKSQTLDNSTTKYPSNKAVKDSQDIQDSEIAEMQEILSNIPTTTGEGESITLDNTMKCKHTADSLGGNTNQETTEGNQLFNVGSPTSSNVTLTFENDILNLNGTGTYRSAQYDITEVYKANPSKIIKFVYESIDLSQFTSSNTTLIQLKIVDNGTTSYSQLLYSSETSSTHTIPSDTSGITSVILQIYVNNSNTSVTSAVSITKPMLQFGTTEKTYEKYTGGIPSPNPSFPSPVNVVKGDNEVKIENKNIIASDRPTSQAVFGGLAITNNGDGSYTISGTTTSNSVSISITDTRPVLKPNTTYTQVVETISGTKKGSIVPSFRDSSGTIKYNYFSDNQSKTTTEKMTCYAYNYYIAQNNTEVNWTFRAMLTEGTDTTYQPHVEQNYPISLGNIELAKIGSYQDKLFKAISGDVVYDSLSSTQKEGLTSGSWYKENDILKVVLDGTEDYIKRTDIPNLSNTSCYRTSINSTINANAMTNTPQVSNKFTCLNNTNDVEHIRYTGAENYRFQVFIDKTRLTTDDSAGMKAWATSNNFIIYYVLATPTFTEITDETLIQQLENWRNSKSYNGQTNISQTNEDKAFVISYTTLKDVYSELDSRLKALEG